MRMLGLVAGWLLLAGGLLGLALHAFLYLDGHYRQAAEHSVRIGRQLAGSAPDADREASQVTERVREDLMRGCLYAGSATVLGAYISKRT